MLKYGTRVTGWHMAAWTTVLAIWSGSGAQVGQIAVGTNGWSRSIAIEPPALVGAAEGADEVLGADDGEADALGAADGGTGADEAAGASVVAGALLVTAGGGADAVGCVPPATTAGLAEADGPVVAEGPVVAALPLQPATTSIAPHPMASQRSEPIRTTNGAMSSLSVSQAMIPQDTFRDWATRSGSPLPLSAVPCQGRPGSTSPPGPWCRSGRVVRPRRNREEASNRRGSGRGSIAVAAAVMLLARRHAVGMATPLPHDCLMSASPGREAPPPGARLRAQRWSQALGRTAS